MKARVFVAVVLLSFTAPMGAAGQGTGVGIEGAVGTQLNGAGGNQSVAIGFSPGQRLQILAGLERIHQPTEVTGFGATRGGTTTSISGEVRVSPLRAARVSPYLLASIGGGISRPNVNDRFPERVSNDIWQLFFGGGVRIPVTDRLSAIADVRAGIQGERDTIVLRVPLRAGVAWRF